MRFCSEKVEQKMTKEERLYERSKECTFLSSAQGSTKRKQIILLLTKLISGWPRRNRAVLVMNPLHPSIVIALWEAGFDVTVQEESLTIREELHAELGNRVDLLPCFPDNISAEDDSYDYIVAVGSPNFWEDRDKVLREVKRVACSGALFLFAKKPLWRGKSIFAKGQSKKEFGLSPLIFREDIGSVFPQGKRQWYSMLALPNWLEKAPTIKERAKELILPLAVGHLVGVRINFFDKKSSTPIVIGSPTKVGSGI